MPRVRIEAGGKPPAEIEEALAKAVRAVDLSQDRDFPDPVMQQLYEQEHVLFELILDAMIEDIEAMR